MTCHYIQFSYTEIHKSETLNSLQTFPMKSTSKTKYPTHFGPQDNKKITLHVQLAQNA